MNYYKDHNVLIPFVKVQRVRRTCNLVDTIIIETHDSVTNLKSEYARLFVAQYEAWLKQSK